MELKTLSILLMLASIAAAVNDRMKKGMGGGISDVTDTELKKIPEVVENALAKFETMRDRLEGSYNTGCTLTKPLVTNVKSQVVRGKMYYITVVAGLSPTPKSYMPSFTCSPKPEELQKAFIQCTIKVWSQPIMNSDGHIRLSAEAQDFSIDEDCQPADYKFFKAEHRDQFDQFLKKYPREYSKNGDTSDYEYRFSVFVQNMATIDMMNRFEQGTAKYGPTKFADMTEAEFLKIQSGPFKMTGVKKQAAIPEGPAPEQFDWRSQGAVTPVKNQGMCGSCWAFSAIGNIEGQWQIKKGELISLSEQELVDCDKVDGGCQGGEMSDAYEAIIKLGGVLSEADYPYRGADEKCKFNASEVRVQINGYLNISKNETEMAQWLAANGPISNAINALAMQFYMGGIAHPWKIFCSPASLDHGVLIVGYGVKDGEPYWIIKNSWGEDWGEKGYYLVYRGDGTCGLNLDNTSSTVE